MSRIASNLSGIERALLNRMAEANAAVTQSTLRLATMQKINAPRDNPGGFVTLSRFQSQLSAATAAMSNVNAAASMIDLAGAALGNISEQLGIIRAALVAPQDDSQETIDTAIAAINRLTATDVGGRRLLDGSADFVLSGTNPGQVSRVRVYATGGAAQGLSGTVIAPGQQATLRYTGTGGKVDSGDATITVTGSLGSAEIAVTGGELLTDLAAAINDVSYLTGVTAEAAGDALDFTSVGYGSGIVTAIEVAPGGTFDVTGGDGAGTAYGTSGTAIINGVTRTASSTDGNRYTVNENGLRAEIQFQPGFAGQFDGITVSGGGLTLALSPDLSQLSQLGIPGLQPSRLGGDSGRLSEIASGGPYAGLGGNTARALRIVDEAISQVHGVQGNIDGFYRASVQSASRLLADLEEDLQSSIDAIDLVDVGEETSRLEFYQGLVANGTAGLAVLNQQRAAIVNLIQHIAGLA